MSLKGKVALVTGASRGIGRGVALQLGDAGATVYITGRRPKVSMSDHANNGWPTLEQTADEIDKRGGKAILMYVNHSEISEVRQLFEEIEKKSDGQLDILVNNAFSAIEVMEQLAGKKFWECDPELWNNFNDVGLRNHYYCSVYAARMMVKRKSGLIVNISSPGGLQYIFCVAYGVGKTALDRMAADMAYELRDQGVTVVSLWPGIVSTESFKLICESGVLEKSFDPTTASIGKLAPGHSETPEFTGLAVTHLAADPKVHSRTGRILVVADLAVDYQFKDINGSQPASFRTLRLIFEQIGLKSIGQYLPLWCRLPGWLLTAVNSRF